MENNKLLKKMSIGDVLDYSIEIFKSNFKQMSLLALIFYMPFMVLYSVGASYLSGEMLELVQNVETIEGAEGTMEQLSRFFAYYLSIGLLGIFYYVYSITLKPVMDAGIIRVSYDYIVKGAVPSTRQVIREGFGRFVPLLVNRLLYGLIILGVSTVVVTVLYIGLFILLLGVFTAYAGSASKEPSLFAVVALVILLLAVVSGVLLAIGFFTVKYFFGEQAVILENRSGAGGISRSSELTKGCFWHTGASLLLGWLLFFTIPQMLASLASLLLFVNKELYVAGTTLAQLINSILYPFLIVLSTIVFLNLKIRKEGFDLEQKVDALLDAQKRRGNLMNGETGNVHL